MILSDSVRAKLAPSGKLRVGINHGNPVLAKRDPVSGELGGVAVDLARELARRAGIPLALVAFESAGKMFDALNTGAWDAAFLAIDPARADRISFTPPYVEIEATYLVPPGSSFNAVEDIDRVGVRVGVSAKSAYDLFLTRNLKHAQLVHAADPNSAFELILAGKVDVVAGVKQHLLANAARLSGSRVLEGRFMAIEQALGIPIGRDLAAEYLREFIEDVKASGFVARALEKAGVSEVSVARPA
ncbi:MAG TPA: ABC transporter substrate-binding protein [Methylomirabilota bacterium]|nr:ABC transporter substrate-binding protein [Methylomirabilota bacterium]